MATYKGIYVGVAFLIYAALISLFFKFSTEGHIECTINQPCIRFCSDDVLSEILWAKFENTSLYRKHFNVNVNCNIIRGKPKCKNMYDAEPKGGTYDFTPWGSVYYDYMYKTTKYCLFESANGTEGWRLSLCGEDLIVHDAFYTFSVVLSVIIMGFTIAVYGYHQELRDTHGKCLISLMSSLILIYLFLPNTEFTKFITTANSWTLFMIMMMFTGLLLTFLCFSTIVYHLMFKLKYLKTDISARDTFMPYFIFILVMILLSITILLLDMFSNQIPFRTRILVLCLIGCYVFILIVVCCLIIYTSYLLIKRSIDLESEEEVRKYSLEKKWYYMHLSTFLLVMIIFPFEFLSWRKNVYTSTKTSVVVDLIKLYTAINFCVIFVLRNSVQVKVVDRYQILKLSATAKIVILTNRYRRQRNEGENEENPQEIPGLVDPEIPPLNEPESPSSNDHENLDQ